MGFPVTSLRAKSKKKEILDQRMWRPILKQNLFHRENWGNSGRPRDIFTGTVTQKSTRAGGNPESIPQILSSSAGGPGLWIQTPRGLQLHLSMSELRASSLALLSQSPALQNGYPLHKEATGISWGKGCKCFLA